MPEIWHAAGLLQHPTANPPPAPRQILQPDGAARHQRFPAPPYVRILSLSSNVMRWETIMAKTKWGVAYNADALSLDDMLHFAPLAEQAGADSIWTAEAWRDAFVPLTAMAGTVKTVRVGTGIAQMARPPVLTALSALSMAEYSGGRFV